MVAVSRFVEFSATAPTLIDATSPEKEGRGTRGFSAGTSLVVGNDSFTITLNSNDQLAVNINGLGAQTITLTSGTDLDPRFVARDIAFKLHSADTVNEEYRNAQCEFRNGFGSLSNPGTLQDFSQFIIWSGILSNNTAANTVAVTSPGGRDARSTLGLQSPDENAGVDYSTDFSGAYTGDTTFSGAYAGQFDDFYTVLISDAETVANPSANGGNTYLGSATSDGLYVGSATVNTYTLTIDTTNGSSMGLGSGNVPTLAVVDSPGSDQENTATELLYADHYYDVGALGVRVKFSDSAFGDGDTFTVLASGGIGAAAGPGTAKYIWSSTLGDSSKSIGIGALTTSASTSTQLGTKGVTVNFTPSGNLTAGDRFNVMCRGPQITTSDVTQLNFGNVTVSTNSAVKVVWFELISGAASMSTVKFSLQADGTFSHHDQGDSDTEFHFGTSGAGNSALGGTFPLGNDQDEFSVDDDGLGNIVATDLDSDTPPSYLFATKADLAVVNSADLAETIGNYQGAAVSDFIYLAIKLGANETGANSTINYRMFFDFA